MARTIGSSGPKTMAAIRKASLQLIFQKGYEAFSLRELATMVGIQSGSLYNHFPNKQAILVDLLTSHLNDLLERVAAAIPTDAAPLEQLEAFVRFHVSRHVRSREQVFVANSELRSLSPENYALVVGLRKKYERRLIDILNRGVKNRSLRIPDTTIAAYAILSMVTGVVSWYQPGGRKTESQLIKIYWKMILNGVCAPV